MESVSDNSLKITSIAANVLYYILARRKLPKFHLISWCGNFVVTPETLQKLCVSTNFHTRKFDEIAVSYAVLMWKLTSLVKINWGKIILLRTIILRCLKTINLKVMEVFIELMLRDMLIYKKEKKYHKRGKRLTRLQVTSYFLFNLLRLHLN